MSEDLDSLRATAREVRRAIAGNVAIGGPHAVAAVFDVADAPVAALVRAVRIMSRKASRLDAFSILLGDSTLGRHTHIVEVAFICLDTTVQHGRWFTPQHHER